MDELIAILGHAFRSKPDHDRIFIDCTNAFNRIDRAEAAKMIKETCPALAKYFYFLYDRDTIIWSRNSEETWKTILGAQGGTQGCVLAPMVFGFGSLKLYRDINSFLKDKDNAIFGGYLDDSVISAAFADAVEAFKMYQRDGPTYGMDINYALDKTVVLLGRCGDLVELQHRIDTYKNLGIPCTNIKIHPEDGGEPREYGYIHLGIPVGHKEYQAQHLNQLFYKFVERGECDNDVEEAQNKWVFLLWVVRQKFPFWFRHMCPSLTSSIEKRIEIHMRKKFNGVYGQSTSDLEWLQACLPVKAHGCGLGRPTDIISAAFAANVEETYDAVVQKLPITEQYMSTFRASSESFAAYEFLDDATKTFMRHAREKKKVITDAAEHLGELPALQVYDSNKSSSKRKTQHFYSDFINRSRAKEMELGLEDHATEADQARFRSNNGSFAGAWLFNIPKDRHSTMTTTEFRGALKLRLGGVFHMRPRHCCCRAKTEIDPQAYHLFTCNEMKPFMLMRHNAIKDEIMQLAKQAGVKAVDSGLGRMIHEDGRQGDTLFHDMGRNATHLVVDYSIVMACAQSYVQQACSEDGYAMKYMEKIKNDKYKVLYRNVGVDFMPFLLEVHGAIADDALKFIKKLASAIAELHDIPYCIMFSYWQRRISTSLQRANAKLMYLAQCKIDGLQPHGVGFADTLRIANNEQSFLLGEGFA